jgi:hypothetical protein
MKADPFAEYRAPRPSFDSVTGPDGRTLTLVAVGAGTLHDAAQRVVEIANRVGWRVTRMHPHGPNIELLTITPHR